MADSNDFFSSFGLHHDSNFFHRVSYAEDELAGGSPSWRGRSSHNNDNSSRPWEDFVSPGNRSQPHPPSQRHDSYPNRNPFTPPPRVQYRDSADFSSDSFMRAVHTSQSSTSTYPYTPRFIATAPQLIPSAQPRTSTFHIPTQTPPSPEELFRYANSPRPPHPYFDDEMPPSASRSRKRPAPEPTSDRPKRTRVPDSEEEIDEVNLTSNDPMDAVLEKERQELLKSQENEEEDGPKRFGSMNCIICMDNFTNLTATACGHLFCHECLTQALSAGERADRGTGSCPVCRKPLKRATKGHVIPLALMTRKKYQTSQRT